MIAVRSGADNPVGCPRETTVIKRTQALPLLILAMLVAHALPASGAPTGKPSASRAATFVGIKGTDTLFVERVRDVPGGFRGEVSIPGSGVWVRYRVELGPDEDIRRYDLEMARMPGNTPVPVLVARRGQDSILIEPRPGAPFPAMRLAVPPSAIMGTTEMAVFEQAIRYGMRRGATNAEFPMVSAWTGKRFDAVLATAGRDKVRLTTADVWEFTLDPQRRIVSGARISGDAGDPALGIRVVRVAPSPTSRTSGAPER